MDGSQVRVLRRVMIGEAVGVVSGIGTALLLLVGEPEPNFAYKAGLVLYCMLAGAFIGFLGYYTVHPTFGFPLKWPLRGAIAGFGLMLVPLLLNLPAALSIAGVFGVVGPIPAALSVLLLGVAFGIVADFVCTRLAGEGPAADSSTNSLERR